jgi:3-hydroxybutyryl-CoA dehydratase
MAVNKTYAELKIGDRDSITKKITPEVVAKFADVSEDFNPLHLDPEYAKTTRFGRNIAHGMLCAGLLSAVIGVKLPGEAIYMTHNFVFKRPVFVGDTVTAWAEVIEKIDDEKKIFKTRSWVENSEGKVLVDGEATFMAVA